jgi:molybdopterin-guanine dinucleotide biosynthesis protein A
MAQRIGVVLAGGAGTRIGFPKGALELDGRTLAARAAAALWPLCGTVLISVPPDADNPAPAFPKVEDEAPAGRGPLSGIAAAFACSGRADLVVLACDYPRVDTEVLRRIVARAADSGDVVMPTDRRGVDHPLVAMWRRSAQLPVADALRSGHFKVGRILAELAVRRLGPADFDGLDLDLALVNLNTPQDLAALGRGTGGGEA